MNVSYTSESVSIFRLPLRMRTAEFSDSIYTVIDNCLLHFLWLLNNYDVSGKGIHVIWLLKQKEKDKRNF